MEGNFHQDNGPRVHRGVLLPRRDKDVRGITDVSLFQFADRHAKLRKRLKGLKRLGYHGPLKIPCRHKRKLVPPIATQNTD